MYSPYLCGYGSKFVQSEGSFLCQYVAEVGEGGRTPKGDPKWKYKIIDKKSKSYYKYA